MMLDFALGGQEWHETLWYGPHLRFAIVVAMSSRVVLRRLTLFFPPGCGCRFTLRYLRRSRWRIAAMKGRSRVAVVLSLLLCSCLSYGAMAQCSVAERQALLDFKANFIDYRGDLATWSADSKDSCCGWKVSLPQRTPSSENSTCIVACFHDTHIALQTVYKTCLHSSMPKRWSISTVIQMHRCPGLAGSFKVFSSKFERLLETLHHWYEVSLFVTEYGNN